MSDIRIPLKEEITRLEAKAAKGREALALIESEDGVPCKKSIKKEQA